MNTPGLVGFGFVVVVFFFFLMKNQIVQIEETELKYVSMHSLISSEL